jgi:hypothetical protein
MPAFSLDTAPQDPYRPASLQHRRSSTARTYVRTHSFGTELSPVTLSAQDHSTSELLRTLSRVAASKPTSWLSKQSHIVYHLVQI